MESATRFRSTGTSQTGYVYDDIMLRHRGPNDHPERPARIRSIYDALEGGKQAQDTLTHACTRLQTLARTRTHMTRIGTRRIT